jgi:hypothetical protein
MNGPEFVTLLVALMVTDLYLVATFRSARVAVMLAAATIPALFLSLEGTSQFLVIDEMITVPEALNLPTSSVPSWIQGALRTTDAAVGLSMAAVGSVGFIFLASCVPTVR